jgi:hypothetical protein
MNNQEKLATQSTQDEEKQSKTQHNMCWTPPHANKYKQRKQDMIPLQTTGRKDEPNVVLYGNRNGYVLMVDICIVWLLPNYNVILISLFLYFELL